MPRYLHHVDDVRQIILRITESQRPAQFVRLSAIRLNLGEQTLFVELREILIQDLLIVYILGICDYLHIVRCGMIVLLVAFLDALRTGQNPMEKLREPGFQGF